MSSLVRAVEAAVRNKVAITIALVVGALMVTSAAFSQAGEPLTVSPTEGPQFTDVTVSGSNCRRGAASSVVGALTGSSGTGSRIEGTPFETAATGTIFTATPDASGTWTASFRVPPFVAAGQYEIRAICKLDANATTGDEYQPRGFTVLAATSPEIFVSPRQAPAGQEVRLTVSGTLCPGPSSAVDVGVFERVPESIAGADEFVARATFQPDAAGAWTGTVSLPATARAGTYGVAARCLRGGLTLFNYLPVPNVVLIGASVPTRAPIALTG